MDANPDSPCEGARYGFTVSNLASCDVPVAVGGLDLTNIVRIDTFAGTMTTIGNVTSFLLYPFTG